MLRKTTTLYLIGVALWIVPPAADVRSASLHDRTNVDMYDAGEWQKISGTVKKIKTVAVGNRDREHLVIQLETKHGHRMPVDLGDADELEHVSVRPGSPLTAWGRVVSIGDTPVFMAHRFYLDTHHVIIPR